MHSNKTDNLTLPTVQPGPADVLADVYSLRRKVTIGVYAAVTLDLPLYYVTGYTLMQIAMVAVLGWIIAGVSIFLAFNQIIKLRKRTSYPELLLVRLADTADSREAAEEALFILEGLLGTSASFIAVQGLKSLEVAASRGMDEDEAQWVMETHASQLEAALANRFPTDVLGSDGCAAFVPIIALKRAIGVLYLSCATSGHSMERGLLNDIGGALGLSLENMRQKEQLLQKEGRLRSVITGAPIVLFSVNNSGVVVFQQGQAMDYVGIEPESLIGRTVWDIYANYPAVLQSFRRAFAGDEVLSTAVIEANGNRVIFEYRLAPEKDEHGRVTGVIGVATDITQRTKVEDALREGERFLTTLVSNLPGFVIRLEGEPLTIKYVSDGVEEITGFAAADLIDRPIEILGERVHPDDRVLLRETVRRARETGETIEFEVRFNTRVGDERWFWQQGQVISDEDGQPVALEMFVMDVTERKQATNALKESERFLSTLVGNLPGFVLRLSVNEPHTIQYVSSGVSEFFGLRPDELIGRPGISLGGRLDPGDLEQLRRRVLAAGLGDGAFEYEFRMYDGDGNEKWLLQQGQIVRDNLGNPVAAESFNIDVTERRRAANALKENERFLETLVGNLPGFVMRFNTADPRTITYISEGVEDVLGLQAREVIGQPISFLRAMMDESGVGGLVARILEAARTSGTFEHEFRGRDSAGNERWFWQQGEILKDSRGQPIAIESFTMDVTERRQAEERLRESERFLSTLVGNLPGFVVRMSIGPDPRILYVTEAIREALGVEPEEVIGEPISVLGDRLADEDRWRLATVISAAAGTENAFEVEFPIRHLDGKVRWMWAQGQVLVEEGSPRGVDAFVMDVTERKQADQALEESEQRFRDIFENARDAMFTYNFDGMFVAANGRMAEMLGYTPEEMLGLSVGKVVAPEHHEIAAEGVRRVFNGERSSYEVDLLTKHGDRLPVEITCRFVLDEKGDPYLVQGIGRDIRERREAEETIRRLAYHDSLTGLPNRALFEDRLQMALAQAKRHAEKLAVLFLDVDGFKLVNDTLGHTSGDRLLQLVAQDLSALVRDCDTVARVGGDEFTILLPSLDEAEDVSEVAQRILECLRQPRLIAGQEFRATASIGITTFPADGEDGETLLRNADTAMYRAKDNGRDHYQLFTPAMNERVADRLSFEQSLRQALIKHELAVFYQPIVDVTSGRVVAAEALVRWFHPSRGLVAPDEFIPLAEETGIILDIGDFILREATHQYVLWREQGLELNRVTVNVSARQLQQEDMVARVSRIIAETGIEPRRLQLEITEGAVLKNVDYAIAMLRELREMGVGISLDDFGTGYSSLTYLKRFPVDAVKIDRSFVRDLDHDAHDATIVSTVIGMAQTMGLRVIAEGVETPQQLEFLRARRCAEYQGYLFSRPVPPEEFSALVMPTMSIERNGTRKKNGKALPAGEEPTSVSR